VRPRAFHHAAYPVERIARERRRLGLGVSVCLPARECAATVGQVVRALCELRVRGALDEVVVIDAASADGTAQIAREAGADVRQEAELLAEFGPVLGKGDAMWRALSVLEGDLVCFLDADTEDFGPHFVTGLIGPSSVSPTWPS
jgi:glucosyl-3-phosphoglycerate synthase